MIELAQVILNRVEERRTSCEAGQFVELGKQFSHGLTPVDAENGFAQQRGHR